MNDHNLYVPLQKSGPIPASIGRIIVDLACAGLTVFFMVKAFSLVEILVKLHVALVAP